VKFAREIRGRAYNRRQSNRRGAKRSTNVSQSLRENKIDAYAPQLGEILTVYHYYYFVKPARTRYPTKRRNFILTKQFNGLLDSSIKRLLTTRTERTRDVWDGYLIDFPFYNFKLLPTRTNVTPIAYLGGFFQTYASVTIIERDVFIYTRLFSIPRILVEQSTPEGITKLVPR